MANGYYKAMIMSIDNIEERNPCDFKPVCKGCNMVEMIDRPDGCIALSCPDYTPCPECLNNRPLDPVKKICGACLTIENKGAFKSKVAAGKLLREKMQQLIGPNAVTGGTTPDINAGFPVSAIQQAAIKKYSITPPGTPPEQLGESESIYYKERWQEYLEYYRDPTASALIHFIILEEIDLHRTEYYILSTQGELHEALQKEKGNSLKYLAMLKENLPDKEARKETDDETSLAMVYEKYQSELAKQTKITSNGIVKRIFSHEAIALAPELPHKIDLKALMIRCGYSVESTEAAFEKYHTELGVTPEEILDTLGFKLKEKYAMPYDPSVELNEDAGSYVGSLE